MKKAPILKHLGIASAILVVSYLLFTLFPGPLPHAEDFSPTAFFTALGFVLLAWLRLKKRQQKTLYLVILLLCGLALLDEIGYGTEVFGFQPLYFERYHVEIRDLHSLGDFVLQVVTQELGAWNWNGERFAGFFRLDACLFVGVFIFTVLLRNGMRNAKQSEWQARISWLASGFILLAGIAASGYLLFLPADPSNAFIFGISFTRLTGILVVLAFSAILIAFFLRQKKSLRQKSLRKVQTWLSNQNKRTSILIILWSALLLGFAYQIASSFNYLPFQEVRLERLDPLIFWLFSVAIILLIAFSSWQGRLRRPITETAEFVFAFFRQEPAFVYTAFAVALIVIAQAIDQDVILLREWIQTPNYWISNWGLWTEEVFEMTAAYEFIAASFFFPRKK